MRVSRIEFNGYRRLAQTATGIDGPITAFVGFNEAGKTTLLTALEWFSNGGELPSTDENRSRPPATDSTAVVKVYFEMDNDDKRAFSSIQMDNPPSSLILYRKRDGGRVRDLRPRPTRPAEPFTNAAERLTKARAKLAAQFRSAVDEGERGPNEWATALSEQLSGPDDDWPEARVEDLSALSKWLQETPSGLKRARDALLGELLDEIHSLVVQDHPIDSVWQAIEKRVPSFVLFTDEDRNLETTYLLQPEKRDIPPAVVRLLSISGLDIDKMWDYIQNGDSTRRETALERANEKLRELFARTWNQSNITVRLNINGQRLEVMLKELHGDGDVTSISERSDGLRTFVSLVAFLESGGHAVPPVLLIDEAETHLHYDAQADLVGALLKSVEVEQVLYTTHSPGCLPSDLGTGIRVVSRDPDHMDASILKNNFWEGAGPGYSPLLFAMGAGAAAFSMCRSALLAEGASDMVLLPSLIRNATRISDLDYQVAPGLANAHGSGIRVEEVAARVAYLTDGDRGGAEHRKALKAAGVDESRIFALPKDHAVEDLIEPDDYLAVVNTFLEAMGQSKRFAASDIQPSLPIATNFSTWAKKNGVRSPSKVEIAYALLRSEFRLTPAGRRALQSLHTSVMSAFGEATR